MAIEYFLILLSILVIIIHHKKPVEDKVENFVNGNFQLCDETDCECLKLNRAPDGECTKEKIPKIPPIPGYEENILYNQKALKYCIHRSIHYYLVFLIHYLLQMPY